MECELGARARESEPQERSRDVQSERSSLVQRPLRDRIDRPDEDLLRCLACERSVDELELGGGEERRGGGGRGGGSGGRR